MSDPVISQALVSHELPASSMVLFRDGVQTIAVMSPELKKAYDEMEREATRFDFGLPVKKRVEEEKKL